MLRNVTVVQEAQDLFASIDDHEGIELVLDDIAGLSGSMKRTWHCKEPKGADSSRQLKFIHDVFFVFQEPCRHSWVSVS